MKKLLFSIAVLLSLSTTAQTQNDVTEFLGIPVDGTKWEMIRRLKARGFRSTDYDREVLKGEFNGRDVNVHVVTNNNKVYRIMIADATTTDERNIRARFNTLCRQFENNPKYISLNEDQTISDDEKIFYEMTIKKRCYQAVFYQKPEDGVVAEKLKELITSEYTEDQLANPTEEIEQKSALLQELLLGIPYENKVVWFTIAELRGKFYIVMYYDNTYNQANGDNL